jgi:hypothetical protein
VGRSKKKKRGGKQEIGKRAERRQVEGKSSERKLKDER